MGRPHQFQLDDRRQSVVHFLNEGLSPREIARKLRRRIEIIERDIKAIEADRETWNLVDQTGVDYSVLKEEIRLEEEERLAEIKRLKAWEEEVERLEGRARKAMERSKPKPVSRGPKGAWKHIAKRRAVVLELRYRGVKQREISRMLNTPLRTIQADYAHLRKRDYEVLKAQEIMVRERLSVFNNEEVVEALLGSPERQKELSERPQDPGVRFDLRWIQKKR